MKKLYYLIVIVLISSLVLTGCSLLSNISQVPATGQSGISYLTKNGILNPDLVGLWHFDDDALDSSGNNNDGTVYGASWVDGKFGKALSFDGSDDYVDCGTNIVITTAITIEAWINPSAFTNYDAIVANFVWPINPEGYSFRVMANGKLVWRAVLSGNSAYSITSDSTMEAGNWYHVVLTHDASCTRLYINGILEKEDTPGGTIVNLGKSLKVGWDTYAADRVFNGIIDEVRIWDEALSGDDIGESYSLGAIEFTKELTEVLPEPVGWVGDMPQVSIDTSVTFTMPITVNNQSLLNLNDAWVKDRLGAELEVVPYVVGPPEEPFDETIGEATYYTKGKSEKVFIDWYLNIGAGSTETLTIVAKTDINPGGGNKIHQEYTSPDIYELNSGATLTFHVTVAGEDISLVVTTDGLLVEAVGIEND